MSGAYYFQNWAMYTRKGRVFWRALLKDSDGAYLSDTGKTQIKRLGLTERMAVRRIEKWIYRHTHQRVWWTDWERG